MTDVACLAASRGKWSVVFQQRIGRMPMPRDRGCVLIISRPFPVRHGGWRGWR